MAEKMGPDELVEKVAAGIVDTNPDYFARKPTPFIALPSVAKEHARKQARVAIKLILGHRETRKGGA